MQSEVSNARDGLAPNVDLNGGQLSRLNVGAHGHREGSLVSIAAAAGAAAAGAAAAAAVG